MNIQELFAAYAQAQKTIEDFRAELPPEIVRAEKDIETIKKALQDHAKALDGYAAGHPEILPFKKETVVATVRRMK